MTDKELNNQLEPYKEKLMQLHLTCEFNERSGNFELYNPAGKMIHPFPNIHQLGKFVRAAKYEPHFDKRINSVKIWTKR